MRFLIYFYFDKDSLIASRVAVFMSLKSNPGASDTPTNAYGDLSKSSGSSKSSVFS